MEKHEKNASAQVNMHKGHRQRMKDGFYKRGFEGLADHEVLEMLLYFGIPQRDTNTLAHSLIERFGSFSGVIDAERTDLLSVKGMSESAACLLKMILPAYTRYMEDISKRKATLTTTQEIVDYLKPYYVGATVEKVYVLCFDSNHHLLACRMINEGDILSSDFDLRKLVSVVLETKANSVVISHNHPHGITLPSRDDVAVTSSAYKLLESLKVKLLDHVIISETSYNSMVRMPAFAHIFCGYPPFSDD